MKKMMWIFIVTFFAAASISNGDTLWEKDKDKGNTTSCAKSKLVASEKGDSIHIKIVQKTDAKSEEKIDTKTKSGVKGKIAKWFRTATTHMPEIDASGEKSHKGEGTQKKTDQVTAEIQAQVVEVLPNLNMVIQAKSTTLIGKELQTMIFTGEISPRDIDKETNTILSTYVMNPVIRYVGKGPISGANKKGILNRILDFIWVF